jgi:hypothetical protein
MANSLLIDCSNVAACFEAHQLFAGSCFSSALARGTLSLVVNGGCCAALCFTNYPQVVIRATTASVLGEVAVQPCGLG